MNSIPPEPENRRIMLLTVVFAGSVLFTCSTVRHVLLQSGAYDLGIFDQAIPLSSVSVG